MAQQARTYAQGAYSSFAREVAQSTGVEFEGTGLSAAAADADGACGELAEWLATTLAPLTHDDDRCGLERYKRWYRYWNGCDLDVEDLYAWGWQDLQRIKNRMWELAGLLAPDATTLMAVAEVLDHDDARAINGADALLEKLDTFTKATVGLLDGAQFDIDPRIRRCDVRLAPQGSAAGRPSRVPQSAAGPCRYWS